MIEVKGKYNEAIVFAKRIDRKTEEQIKAMCNTEELKDTIIRIMPDCHAGAGCTIGTTMKMDRNTPLNPYYVGVDIGCGVKAALLSPSSRGLNSAYQTPKSTSKMYMHFGVLSSVSAISQE